MISIVEKETNEKNVKGFEFKVKGKTFALMNELQHICTQLLKDNKEFKRPIIMALLEHFDSEELIAEVKMAFIARKLAESVLSKGELDFKNCEIKDKKPIKNTNNCKKSHKSDEKSKNSNDKEKRFDIFDEILDTIFGGLDDKSNR